MISKIANDNLEKLKIILQTKITPRNFERFVAALISELAGVSISIAKSGFQHGGDAGPAGRQGRRFRIETKRYADNTALSDRELLGEIDHAVELDPAMEAWFLVATREVSEQLEQSLLAKSESLGLPIVVIDWKQGTFPALAALCVTSPQIIEKMISPEAANLVRALEGESHQSQLSLVRDLEYWNLGFESLRNLSLKRLETIWTVPKASMATLGQDAAGGNRSGTILRQHSFSNLLSWWNDEIKSDVPAVVIGHEGVGKTWAVLDWLFRQEELPITLVIPSNAVAGFGTITSLSIRQFLGQCLFDLTKSRNAQYWEMRVERLLQRPADEGPTFLIFFDGINQEPSVRWVDIIRAFQDITYSGRVRLICTTRHLYFKQKLSSLNGLIEKPRLIEVNIYDDMPGGELDQRLIAEGLSRKDLHNDLVQLARTPRLFALVIKFRERLVEAGQVTVHRLLWEYGRDTFGVRAPKSFSESDWREWLQGIAERYLKGTRNYTTNDLSEIASRADLNPTDVFHRLSDIVDGRFVEQASNGKFEPTPSIIAHALGAALLNHLQSVQSEAAHQYLSEWFDPLDGLDEKPEILRAAVSILLEQHEINSASLLSLLVSEWLHSQNLSDEHRLEVAGIAVPLCDSLLDVIEHADNASHKSARVWAVNSLRSIPRIDATSYAKILSRAAQWLHVVSRDVEPANQRNEESEKYRANRFQTRVGFDRNGTGSVLGHTLKFVASQDGSVNSTIPALLEGFSLKNAVPVFELAALSMVIRGREQYWDELKWICLLNAKDFNETTTALAERSAEIANLLPEEGVHKDLPSRVAALLLWLSGDEANEIKASKINPSIDHSISYERDYLANPEESFCALERRHVEQILLSEKLTTYQKIYRSKHFFADPNLVVPNGFLKEIRAYYSDLDVSKLDVSVYQTRENLTFENDMPILARCAPDLLAELIRKKMASFSTRPFEHRRASAIHICESLLIADVTSVKAAEALRSNFRDEDETDEAHSATQFLFVEVLELSGVEQTIKIIKADLKYISIDFKYVLKTLTEIEVDLLIDLFKASNEKQISDLIILLSFQASELSEIAWNWISTFLEPNAYQYPSVLFELLNKINSSKFGKMLLTAEWSWQPGENMECNHYGTLSLIAATTGLPFEQHISALAPWLLPRAVKYRGSVASEAQLAAQVLSAIIKIQDMVVPDLGSKISVNMEIRESHPFAISVLPIHQDGEDLFAALKRANDESERISREKAVDAAITRIKSARSLGAKLYLHNITSDDLASIVEHAPAEVLKWIDGADQITSDFARRVRLAEGFYLALCEVLLNVMPEQGVILWRALDQSNVSSFLGRGNVDEMIHLLFRASKMPEILLHELLDIHKTNTDKALFELRLAASINHCDSWIETVISNDSTSGSGWMVQRAQVLKGFATENTLAQFGSWPRESSQNLPTTREHSSLRWRQKEAFARYWWESYWRAETDDIAYAAWIVFLQVVDRRMYVWMHFKEDDLNFDAPHVKRRLSFYNINKNKLKAAIKKQEENLVKEFLGRKIADDISPWIYN